MTKILPTVTTIGNDRWREQIEDIRKLKIKEFALFPTALNTKAERQECYALLEKLDGISIPFVHARHDMPVSEYEYLMTTFGTQLFNLHVPGDFPPVYDLSTIRHRILIENSYSPFEESDVEGFGGACIDFAHLEYFHMFNQAQFVHIVTIARKFGAKASHISANTKEGHLNRHGVLTHESHTLTKLPELDYLKHYPQELFGEIACIELTNDIRTQLEAKAYVTELSSNDAAHPLN